MMSRFDEWIDRRQTYCTQWDYVKDGSHIRSTVIADGKTMTIYRQFAVGINVALTVKSIQSGSVTVPA